MQALRCASGGTRASNSGAKATVVHQQGGWACPVARAISLAQPLGWPHSGQRQGSMAAGLGSMGSRVGRSLAAPRRQAPSFRLHGAYPAPATVPIATRPPVVLALLLLGHSLLHFILGWVLELSGDEALHALYATQPALSYLDHPPLVGWIQWPLVALDAPEGFLRLVPEVLWVLTALFIHDTARRLHTLLVPAVGRIDDAGLWAVLAFSLAPVLHILGIGLLPDTLLMLFTAALLWQTLRLLDETHVRQLPDWLLLGALLGLAGLSRYTALFAFLPVLACLLAAHGLRLLTRAGPWIALLLTLALVLPVLLWHAGHDGASLAYPLRYVMGSAWDIGQLLVFLLAQSLLYPLLIWGIFGLRHKVLGGLELDHSQAWLLTFFALPFAVLTGLSGGGASLTHWTAPAWVALAPFAGLGLAALWASGRRRLIWLLGGLQTLFTVGLYALMLLAGPPWISSEAPGSPEPERSNPFADFYGWHEAGLHAVQLARIHHIPRLAVQHRSLASRLAWYARPLPVHVLAPESDQFSLWTGPLPVGESAVLLDWSQLAYQLPVGPGLFERCEPAQSFTVQHAGRAVSRFRLHLCHGWGGRPAPRRQDAA